MLLGKFNQRLVLDASCTNEYHAVSSVVGLDIGGEIVAVDGEDVSLWSENCTAQRLACRNKNQRRFKLGKGLADLGRRQSGGGQKQPPQAAYRPLPAP